MALVVCLVDSGAEADWSAREIYLNQGFYELLFGYCMDSKTNSILKQVVSIGYDDEFRVERQQVEGLSLELASIARNRAIQHPQLEMFQEVLRQATLRSLEVVFSGDMYPDFSRL